MLKAARVQGRPMMVMAITSAAMSHPAAIHRPPKTIQSTLRRRRKIDMGGSSYLDSQVADMRVPIIARPRRGRGDPVNVRRAGLLPLRCAQRRNDRSHD